MTVETCPETVGNVLSRSENKIAVGVKRL